MYIVFLIPFFVRTSLTSNNSKIDHPKLINPGKAFSVWCSEMFWEKKVQDFSRTGRTLCVLREIFVEYCFSLNCALCILISFSSSQDGTISKNTPKEQTFFSTRDIECFSNIEIDVNTAKITLIIGWKRKCLVRTEYFQPKKLLNYVFL